LGRNENTPTVVSAAVWRRTQRRIEKWANGGEKNTVIFFRPCKRACMCILIRTATYVSYYDCRRTLTVVFDRVNESAKNTRNCNRFRLIAIRTTYYIYKLVNIRQHRIINDHGAAHYGTRVPTYYPRCDIYLATRTKRRTSPALKNKSVKNIQIV